jgi:cytochrome c oxidase assembly factor CtaG
MRRTLRWIWLLLLVPATARAHAEDGVWTFDPWVVTPLLLSATMYGLGLVVLWRRTEIGRGIRRWQAACYGAGWLLLAVTLLSPLHWLGEQLFTAHMVEHELIMAVAAPLLALGRPIGAFLWALPVPLERGHCPRTCDNLAWRGDLVLACPCIVRRRGGVCESASAAAPEFPG